MLLHCKHIIHYVNSTHRYIQCNLSLHMLLSLRTLTDPLILSLFYSHFSISSSPFFYNTSVEKSSIYIAKYQCPSFQPCSICVWFVYSFQTFISHLFLSFFSHTYFSLSPYNQSHLQWFCFTNFWKCIKIIVDKIIFSLRNRALALFSFLEDR